MYVLFTFCCTSHAKPEGRESDVLFLTGGYAFNCLVAVIFVIQWIFFILAGNKDYYNISDELEFRPDPTSDCGVSSPLVFEKSIFCIVANLAPTILIGSSSFFEVRRITITSWMSSNLSQIRPWTVELAALECAGLSAMIFFSENAWQIKVKFYVVHPWIGGTKVCS